MADLNPFTLLSVLTEGEEIFKTVLVAAPYAIAASRTCLNNCLNLAKHLLVLVQLQL